MEMGRIEPSILKKYYIYTYRELYNHVNDRLKSIQIPPPPSKRRDLLITVKNTLLAKLAACYNIVNREYTKIIEALEKIESMHPFYQELFKTHVGVEPGELARRFRINRRNMRRIYLDIRSNIKSSLLVRDAITVFRRGLGRILSFYKRNSRVIEKIKEAIIELSKMPDITGELVVIIAGMPQVGKSTLITRLTRARPEIANYPFTTKNIIAGHISMEPYGRIVLLDTPGLLDRPLEEKNPIELKAIHALKHLADKVLFLFDISINRYYEYSQQLRVYRDVEELIGSDKIYPVINKIDATPENTLKKYVGVIEGDTGRKPLLISALRGDGLDQLLEMITGWFWMKNQSRKP